MIAGYTEVDGRLVPIVVAMHSRGVTVMRNRDIARAWGVFGDTFVIGSLVQLGGAVARNIADAFRPEAVP